MNKTQKLYLKAKKIIPGGTQLLSKRPEMFAPNQWPTYYKKSKGCEVEDLEGKKFIDMSYMGIGSCTLGFADDEVDTAVKEANRQDQIKIIGFDGMPDGKKAIKSPRGGGEISWSRARQFPDRAAQSGYDSPERDFVGTHLDRKVIPVPREETLEHRLGFKGRVRDRRNGIPKVGLKEVVDMWPGYMKQEGLIPGQCIVDNRTPDNVVPKPHKVTPLTYEEKKRRDRLRGEMGDVSGLTNAAGDGDDALASWEERTGYYVWKTKAVRASAAPSARASRDSEVSQAEPEAAPG